MSSLMQQVLMVQSLFMPRLLAIPNVVGVAVGYKESQGVRTNQLALVALVEEKKPAAALAANEMIPKQLEGIATDVYEVGKLMAQQNPRDRFRPVIPCGVSMGHFKVTAGTFGAIVTDRITGEKLLLSNNHVFANSNDAAVGDAILQPGVLDGGQNPGDVVARLARFVQMHYLEDPVPPPPPPPTQPPPTQPPPTPPPPTTKPPDQGGCDVLAIVVGILNGIATLLGSGKRVASTGAQAAAQTAGTTSASGLNVVAQAQSLDNMVDCAVAKPLNPAVFTGDILGIGKVSGTKAPSLGMRVRKSGRTTGYTEGMITLLNATVNVGYTTSRGARTARFVGQVITEPLSQGGDSGSLIVDRAENKAVGLLFAGSHAATIFTPIDRVLESLNVTL